MGLVLANIIPGPLLPLAHTYQTPPAPRLRQKPRGKVGRVLRRGPHPLTLLPPTLLP